MRHGLPSWMTPAPSVHLKIKISVTVRRGISKRSHEKIGDCEQSIARRERHDKRVSLFLLLGQPPSFLAYRGFAAQRSRALPLLNLKNCKSSVNIMCFKSSNVSLIFLREDGKCLDGVNYQIVPRFFLLSSSDRRIFLTRCGVYSRATLTGNSASNCGV